MRYIRPRDKAERLALIAMIVEAKPLKGRASLTLKSITPVSSKLHKDEERAVKVARDNDSILDEEISDPSGPVSPLMARAIEEGEEHGHIKLHDSTILTPAERRRVALERAEWENTHPHEARKSRFWLAFPINPLFLPAGPVIDVASFRTG